MKASRLTRARQLAGLSIQQAIRLLGWTRTQPLLDFETGDAPCPDDVLVRLADLYGVTVAWLKGHTTVLPLSTVDMLRDVEHTSDRARITEVLESISEVKK